MIPRILSWLHRKTAQAPKRVSTKLSPAYEKRRVRELRHAREVIERILREGVSA
jgi:hypothetical protein